MKPRIAKIVAVASIFCISAALGCNSQKTRLPEASIRLKWLNQAQFAGFYYAKEGGLYEQNGVQVTLHPGGVDYPAIQMVASGSDQFGVTGADQILLAREKGIPVVAVAAIYRQTPFVLFSLKKSGIARIEDFPGKRIGVKLGGNEELTYRAMLGKSKINGVKLNEIPVKFDISPLLTGRIDAWPGYSINEPITAEENGYAVNLIAPRDYGLALYADVLFTTEEMIRTQPSVVNAVVHATVKGWEEALSHPDQAVAYTLKYGNQLVASHEMRMLKASEAFVRPDTRPIGSMDREVWEEMQRLLLNLKFMQKPGDVQQAFRVDFLPGGRP